MLKYFAEKNVSSFCSAKATHIFSAKNIRILYIECAKTVNEMTLNELVKLTRLWTTGPRIFVVLSTNTYIWNRYILTLSILAVFRLICGKKKVTVRDFLKIKHFQSRTIRVILYVLFDLTPVGVERIIILSEMCIVQKPWRTAFPRTAVVNLALVLISVIPIYFKPVWLS